MKEQMLIAGLVSLLFCAACAGPAQRGREVAVTTTDSTSQIQLADTSQPVRVSPEETNAAEPAVAAAPDGSVFVAWIEHRPKRAANVWLAHLDGEGNALNAPARVNSVVGEATAWHGDPPTVGIAPDGGAVYVGWTAHAAAAAAGAAGHHTDLYLSTSRDGGQTFATRVKVNDDRQSAAHGMHSLIVAPDGRIHVAWLDERNVAPPPPTHAAGQPHKESNSEVFYASSADGGRSFSPNRRIASEVCPCCKTSLAVDADGRVYVSWRQVLPGEFRHIAVAASTDGGQSFAAPVIVSDDRWIIAGCPVSGSALAVGTDGALLVLWYTAGEAGRPGLYWSESRDGGQTFAPRRPFAESGGRGTPVLLAGRGNRHVAVWENGNTPQPVRARLSGNDRPGVTTALVNTGELPVAALTPAQVFVAYILKHDGSSSIWLVREAESVP